MLIKKLERRFAELASTDSRRSQVNKDIANRQAALSKIQGERETIEKNLARAQNDEQYQAISSEFDQLCDRENTLRAEIADLEAKRRIPKMFPHQLTTQCRL